MQQSDKNPYLKRLGENIRKRRKQLGFTQESLAFEAKIDRSYIGGVERGERNISFLTLVNLAKCLSCSINFLSEGLFDE